MSCELSVCRIAVVYKLCSRLIVNRYNIALRILLIPINVPSISGIILTVVLIAYRRACGIVDIKRNVSVCFLAYDLRAVEIVGGCYSVNGFTCA